MYPFAVTAVQSMDKETHREHSAEQSKKTLADTGQSLVSFTMWTDTKDYLLHHGPFRVDTALQR